MKKTILLNLMILMASLFITISATAAVNSDIPIAINATLVTKDTDGVQHSKQSKLKLQRCKVGDPFPVPEITGYLPDLTNVPKIVTPKMASIQHQITYNALPAKIVVHYVDCDSQKEIIPSTILSEGTLDGKYQINVPSVPNYKLTADEALTGTITQEEQHIILKFEKDMVVEPEQPEENKPDENQKPEETNKIPDEKPEENVRLITILHLSADGKLLRKESKTLSSSQLTTLFEEQWQIKGYQFIRCQYNEQTGTLSVIYQPLPVFITVIAQDTNGKELKRDLLAGKFGETLTITAPPIAGYLARETSKTLELSLLASPKAIFIYDLEETGDKKQVPQENEQGKIKLAEKVSDDDSQVKAKNVPRKQRTGATVKFNTNKRAKPAKRKAKKVRSTQLPQTNEAAPNWWLPILGIISLFTCLGWLKVKTRQK